MIITALIYINTGRDNQADESNKIPVATKHSEKHDIEKTQDNINITKSTDLIKKNNIIVAEDFGAVVTRARLVGKCKGSINDFHNFRRKTPVAEMNKKQLDIYNKLEEQCKQWYPYFESLSEQDKNKIVEYREKRSNEMMKYNFFDEESFGKPEVIAATIKSLQSGVNLEDPFIEEKLMYLLARDLDLQMKIAERMDTKSTSMLANEASIWIAALYLCNYTSRDCGPESSQMLDMCMSNASNCGISRYQSIQSFATYGQFADYQRVADILHELLASDWFLQREIEIPDN